MRGPYELRYPHILKENRKDFDDKTIRSLFGVALKNLPGDEKKLTTAYKAKNWKLLQGMAHKMRGTAAYCRAERMQAACGKLDDYLFKKKDLETITKLYNLALQEIEIFKKQAEKFRK